MRHDFKKIEPKWQAKWEESKIFRAVDGSEKPKFYGLVEFPYPSGAGMHVGHIKAYSSIEVEYGFIVLGFLPIYKIQVTKYK